MPDGSDAGRACTTALLTLPNVITFARLCMVPLAVWFVLEHGLIEAFFVFVAAGLSDALDGWLARRNGGGNSVGALLDPVADKALLVSMYVTLAAVNELPDWLAILVVFRDVVIVGGVIVLSVLGMPVVILPLYVFELNTALQIVPVRRCAAGGYGSQGDGSRRSIWAAGAPRGIRRGLCAEGRARMTVPNAPPRHAALVDAPGVDAGGGGGFWMRIWLKRPGGRDLAHAALVYRPGADVSASGVIRLVGG